LALAIAWGPAVFTAMVAVGYGVGLVDREQALAGILTAVEVPAALLMAVLLFCTPFSRLTGRNYRPRRKWFGLSFLFCAVMNLVVFLFEHPISQLTRAFAIAALIALTACIPLAATSTRWAMRRLGGQRWRALHRLVYLAAGAVIAHLWLVPQDDGPAGNIIATVVYGFAILFRLPAATSRIAAKRRDLGGASLLSARSWI